MWSVITVAKGMWDVTRECLRTLHETIEQDVELIYIENGSPPGHDTVDEADKWLNGQERYTKNYKLFKFPGVPMRFNQYTFTYGVGLAEAWNTGIELATGDNILIVNNDMSFTFGGWLEAFAQYLKDRSVGVVGLNGMSWRHVSFVQGSLHAYRRHVLDEAKAVEGYYFDPQFEFSVEEVDLHYRLAKLGYRVQSCEHLRDRINHIDGTTRRFYKDAEPYMMFLAHSARLRFCYKYPESGPHSIHD